MAFDRFKNALLALQGVSVYQKPSSDGGPLEITSEVFKKIREALGGAIQPISFTKTRWFQADLESAAHAADAGDMTIIGQLWRWMKRDGYIMGLSKTRTAGLVALPQRWRGDPKLVAKLREDSSKPSVFSELVPSIEIAQFAADLMVCGVAYGELLPVVGREYPRFVRLDPEFLRFRWNEQRWYMQTNGGAVPITPGDGHWVMATSGAISPWQNGLWPSLGRAYVTKEHAMLYRSNYSKGLANPARLAYAPNAATEEQRVGFLSRLVAWGANTSIELPPGWDAKLLESNGRGWEVFREEIDTANQEIMIALAGQFVTVTGGTGFANADIHDTIRADLIKETGDALAHVINTQILPQWAINEGGLDALNDPPRMSWDTAPPTDQKDLADSMQKGAAALEKLQQVLASLGVRLDHEEIIARFGWTVAPGAPLEVKPPPGSEPFGGTPGTEKGEKPAEKPEKAAPDEPKKPAFTKKKSDSDDDSDE